MAKNETDLLTERQACQLLGVGPRTLRLWRDRRGLPYLKITNKFVRYRKPDLMQWAGSFLVARIQTPVVG